MSTVRDNGPLSALLAELVAIPSVNAMGRGGEGYGEAAIAEFVLQYLRSRGVDVHRDEFLPGRVNVIGRIDVGAPSTVMLEAHLDTVHAQGMDFPPFSPEVRDGRLYGRGACDTKGSLAAFLHAATTVLKAPGSLRHNVVLAAVADEEYLFRGALRLVHQGVDVDYALAGEPTSLHIVRAHKGVTRYKVVTRGTAAHSAYPEAGENAIYTMAQVVQRMETHAAELAAESGHPLLGRPTLSVGVIEGGQTVNTVPDRCWIEVDRRTLPGETTESVLAPVRRLLREVEGATLEDPYLAVGGMEVPLSSPVLQHLADAIRAERGDVVIDSAHYATDAGIYNSAGIPAVVFGPGDIARAHTSGEFLTLSELDAAASIITRFLTA